MNRRRALALGIAGTGVILCAWSAPHFLRTLDAFRVHTVEVVGTRYLEPHEVLAESGIGPAASVFDDPSPWRDSLLAHPLVADAHIARRPPGTIVIEVRETEPVALVRTPVLQPVDVRGRVLPMDPAFGDLDLPMIGGSPKLENARIADDRVVRALRGIESLRALQPTLWPWVSEVHPGRDWMRVVLRWPENAELLLALPVDSARLEEVRLVIGDLAATGRSAEESDAARAGNDSDLARLRRLDARFAGQVIVSVTESKRTPRSRERS